MKNVQIIDSALNCTYSIFTIDDDGFTEIFPNAQDIEFDDDLVERLGEEKASSLLSKLWNHPVEKRSVIGIHGTIFFGLPQKKRYYPSKRESEMIVVV